MLYWIGASFFPPNKGVVMVTRSQLPRIAWIAPTRTFPRAPDPPNFAGPLPAELDENLFRAKRLFKPFFARGVFGGQLLAMSLVRTYQPLFCSNERLRTSAVPE